MPIGNEWIPAIVISTAAAWIDVRRRVIPNWLTLSGFLGGLVWHVSLAGGEGLLFALAGAASTSLLFLIPFLRGGLGGGDLKLFLALGAFLGPFNGIRVAVAAAIVGGAWAASLLVYKSITKKRYAKPERDIWATRAGSERTPNPEKKDRKWGSIPYGPAIAMGTALCVMVA